LLRDLKGRKEKVGGREGMRQEGEVTLFLALPLYFYAENQHVSLQPIQQTCCCSTHSVTDIRKPPALATSTAMVCETYSLHSHSGCARKESVTAQLKSSGLSRRFP